MAGRQIRVNANVSHEHPPEDEKQGQLDRDCDGQVS